MTVSENSPQSNTRFPVWSPALVMLAVLFTGIVLSWNTAGLPASYFALFAVAMVVCTLFVEPRGLFLTIASFPFWFFIGSLIAAFISAPSGGSGKTRLATSAYPLLERYLWLLIPMAISLVIGLVRWWFYRESLDRARARATQLRRRRSDANRSNEQLSRRARSHSGHRYADARGTRDGSGRVPFDPARYEKKSYETKSSEVRSREELRSASERRRQSGSAIPSPSSTPESRGTGLGSEHKHNVPGASGAGATGSGVKNSGSAGSAGSASKASRRSESPLPPRKSPRPSSSDRWNPPGHYLD